MKKKNKKTNYQELDCVVFDGYKLSARDIYKTCIKYGITINSIAVIKKINEIISREDKPLDNFDICDIIALIFCESKSIPDNLPSKIYFDLLSEAKSVHVMDKQSFNKLIRQTRSIFREEIFGSNNVVALGRVAVQFVKEK